MNRIECRLEQIEFSYNNDIELFRGLSCRFSSGWSGLVGENGCGKTTLLLIMAGFLFPGRGLLDVPEDVLYVRQTMFQIDTYVREFMEAFDGVACRMRGILNIGEDWLERFSSLSHGERKRLELAAAVYRDPEVLLVDEPTNHCDFEAKQYIIRALREYTGCGVIVSHDLDVLEELTGYTVLIEAGKAYQYAAPVKRALIAHNEERLFYRMQKNKVRDELRSLENEEKRRRKLAEGQQRRRSKRGLVIKDHDARFKKNLARITGKDGTGGKLLRQLEGRKEQLVQRFDSIEVSSRYSGDFTFQYEEKRKNVLVSIERQEISLGRKRRLIVPELKIEKKERVMLWGNNGSGKSTLIRMLIKRIEGNEIIYIPQEISEEEMRALQRKIMGMKGKERGEFLALICRMGSRPVNILESESFSPGEIRKLLIADAIGRPSSLIVMDEPTNHLDAETRVVLREALMQYEGALLLVSHDSEFMEGICDKIWEIDKEEDCRSVVRIH